MIRMFSDPLNLDKERAYRPWTAWLLAFVVAASVVMWVVDKVQNGFAPKDVTPMSCVEAGGRWSSAVCQCFTSSACPAGYVCGNFVDGEGSCVLPDALTTDVPAVAFTDVDQSAMPSEINLDVPYTSQAPHANWDLPYQEACEETSFLMAVRYFEGVSGVIDQDVADADIVALTNYVTSQGMGLSLTAEQAVMVIEARFPGYEAEVVSNPTVDDLKGYLANGIPVIVPSAGRELGNPFFSGLGPAFHMLVLRGYTEEVFITNDPGTRQGENYTYPIPTLMEAISDYNDVGPEVGAKNVIVVHP